MNSKITEIQSEIFSFINEEDGQIIKNEYECNDIYDVISHISKKYHVEIKVNYVGGFDSPGYDVRCYAWAAIVDGELYFDDLMQEYY